MQAHVNPAQPVIRRFPDRPLDAQLVCCGSDLLKLEHIRAILDEARNPQLAESLRSEATRPSGAGGSSAEREPAG